MKLARTKKVRLLVGCRVWCSGFGIVSRAKGMYSGGYTIWMFGIKYIVGLEIEHSWGDFDN